MPLHSDPTASQATGNTQQEWIKMATLALKIHRSSDHQWVEAQEIHFTGIFRRLLTDSEEELLAEIPPKARKRFGA